MTKRVNVYLNDPLEKLSEQVKQQKNTGGFSRRLGELVNEFSVIMTLTELPEFSPEEWAELGELLLSSEITTSKISGLHLDAIDIGQPELARKIEKLSPAQRIKLVEHLRKLCK